MSTVKRRDLTAEKNELRKDRISEALTRKWMWDEEYRKKMSEARKEAWTRPEYRAKRCRKVFVTTTEGTQEFDSIAGCARYFNVNTGAIDHRCKSDRYPDFVFGEKGRKYND